MRSCDTSQQDLLCLTSAQVDLHALAACPQLSQLHLQRVGLLQPQGLAGMSCLASLVLLGCTQEHSIMLEVGRAVRELPVSGAPACWLAAVSASLPLPED